MIRLKVQGPRRKGKIHFWVWILPFDLWPVTGSYAFLIFAFYGRSPLCLGPLALSLAPNFMKYIDTAH